MKTTLLTIIFLASVCAVRAQILVKDINPGSGSSYPNNFVTMGNATYFVASDGVHGFELWKTDGTNAGTQMVKDIAPGSDDGLAENEDGNVYSTLIVMNNEVYFFANDDGTGFELWKSDGTEAGTMEVKDIYPGDTGSVLGPNVQLIQMGNYLYFSAESDSADSQLWRTDGTSGGTTMVKRINVAGDASPGSFFIYDSIMLFTASDTTNAGELWRTNGTDVGTYLVKDINPGPNGSEAGWFTEYKGKVYFNADDGVDGYELWVTDGTANGTQLFDDIYAGALSGDPQYLTVLNDKLLFSATTQSDGNELWSTDGTINGTNEIKDINPGMNYGAPSVITVFGNHVFFQADDGTDGDELWTSDGTAAGTQLFLNINTTTTTYISSYPENFVVIKDTMYFDADDSIHGRELYESDGTAAGTVKLNDICAGDCGSYPYQLTALNNMIIFGAYSDTVGGELFRLGNPLTGVAPIAEPISFSVQPNPAKDYILVIADESATGGLLQLLDITGRQILAEQLHTNTCQMNTSMLPGGLYFVKLTGNKGEVGVKKVIVE